MIGVNPIRTGYNGVADDWYGITPGTDGLLILSLVHELLKAGKIDLDYLARFTNAPCLVDEAEGPGKGLLLRDRDGKLIVIDETTGKPAPFDRKASGLISARRMRATAPSSSTSPNATCRTITRPRPSPTAPAYPPPVSRVSQPKSPKPHSTRRS